MPVMPKSQLHAEDSKFYGWATAEVATEGCMQVRQKYVDQLLALPHYANVDIVDLYRLAEEKLTFGKASGIGSGVPLRGIKILDRAFAIAILVGYKKLDDPILQVPMTIGLGKGMPKISL